MSFRITMAFMFLLLVSCASNPSKVKDVETDMDKSEEVTGDTELGVKEDHMVVQKKVRMNEELRRLQNRVYALEDRVYGSRKYGSKGLYGALKQCRLEVVSPKYGGDGKLRFTEPIARVTEDEEEWNVGVDEKGKIVGVSEEFLMDRIERFQEYQRILRDREDEYTEKLEICDAELKAKKEKYKKKQEEELEEEQSAALGG